MPGETGSLPRPRLDSPRQTFSEGQKFILSFCLSFSLSLSLSLYHSSVSFLSVTFCLCLVVVVLFLSFLPVPPPAFFFFKSFSVPVSLSLLPLLFSADSAERYFFLILTSTPLFLLHRPVPSCPVLLCTIQCFLLSSAPPSSFIFCLHLAAQHHCTMGKTELHSLSKSFLDCVCPCLFVSTSTIPARL